MSLTSLSVICLVRSCFFIFSTSPGSSSCHQGLIASVGRGGNMNDIKLVESLVTSYIKKPSCIILLTVACESEILRSFLFSLANELMAFFFV
jgi:hypothetical protein